MITLILRSIIVYCIVNYKETETVAAERVNKICTETERVFEYRFQGSNHANGSGYGLYLVKKSIEAHNGTVKAESSHGRGMGITFTIPKTLAVEDSFPE